MIAEEIRDVVERNACMWVVEVPDVGELRCYSFRWGIVHVMEYLGDRGFDVYAPVTSSNSVRDTADALELWGGEGPPR